MAREPQSATLEQLRERLAEFEFAYELCSYIDHYPDCVRCRELNRHHIDRIRARIAELEKRDHAA